MNIGVNIDFIKGFVVGIRHFDPEEYAPYYEIQLFLLIFRFNIYIFPKQEEE